MTDKPTDEPQDDPLSKLLQAGLVLGALAFVAAFLFVTIQRVSYPYELEWMEGGMVDHVRRILAGEKVYIQPSLEFSPYGYGPVYLWSSAALSKLLGTGFLPLRLISALSTVGSLWVLFSFVHRETGELLAGLLAAGLFAATFEKSGFFFDVARVDSLFVFLLLLTLSWTRRVRSVRAALVVGALFVVLVYTKQIVLPLVPLIAVYFFLVHRRLTLPFVTAFLCLGGATYWTLDALHDGWASFYLFGFHAGRSVEPRLMLIFVRDMSLLGLPVLVAAFFLLAKFIWRKDVPAGLYFLAAFAGIYAAVGYARSLELGAFVNVYMPAHAVVALLFGLGYPEVLRSIRNAERNNPGWKAARLLFIGACLLQFGSLLYDPTYQVPSTEDREAGDQLIELIADIEGPVWLIDHGYLTARAGKETSIHAVSIYDSLSNERTRPHVEKAVLEGLRTTKYDAILMSDKTHRAMGQRFPALIEELERHYTLAMASIFEDAGVLMPVTGVVVRPERLYRRKPTDEESVR